MDQANAKDKTSAEHLLDNWIGYGHTILELYMVLKM